VKQVELWAGTTRGIVLVNWIAELTPMTTIEMTEPSPRIYIHKLFVRIFHWVNVVGMFLMITSGWRIYNASPLFDFRFPKALTIGGWLGGALQWHFAAMWLLVINFLVYLVIGFATGHFRRRMTPVSPSSVLTDMGKALKGKLPHSAVAYNAVQKISYIGVLLAILLTIIAGLVVWKPVQFQELGVLMGGYEGARLIHFLGMSAIVAFIVLHLVLVLIVPSTLVPMIMGWGRKTKHDLEESRHEV
jgi:thiosulfate reductase cytochrome b subunit